MGVLMVNVVIYKSLKFMKLQTKIIFAFILTGLTQGHYTQ